MDRHSIHKILRMSCSYNNPDKKIVFGTGNIDTDIMLVGEAPGKDEEAMGTPFVGAAGQKLNEYLDMVGLSREDLYITNIVKERPLDENYSYPKNRTPNQQEIDRYNFYIEEEIKLIEPRLIITLGSIPLKYFMGKQALITRLHGTYREMDDYYLFFLYHPAAVLYDNNKLEIYEQDIVELRHFLQSFEKVGNTYGAGSKVPE